MKSCYSFKCITRLLLFPVSATIWTTRIRGTSTARYQITFSLFLSPFSLSLSPSFFLHCFFLSVYFSIILSPFPSLLPILSFCLSLSISPFFLSLYRSSFLHFFCLSTQRADINLLQWKWYFDKTIINKEHCQLYILDTYSPNALSSHNGKIQVEIWICQLITYQSQLFADEVFSTE